MSNQNSQQRLNKDCKNPEQTCWPFRPTSLYLRPERRSFTEELVKNVVGPGNAALVLDAHARVFAAWDAVYRAPEDGERVIETWDLVEHKAVCVSVREGEARARAARRQTKLEGGA